MSDERKAPVSDRPELRVSPVRSGDFDDVAMVLGPRGGASDCWCMSWRIPASRQNTNGPEGNRAELARRIGDGRPMGLLARRDGIPVGWASLSPRPEFGRIARSTSLAIDDPHRDDVWSIACFMVVPEARRSGVMGALLEAAIHIATDSGARAIEGYPPSGEQKGRPSHGGTEALFARAGFAVLGEPRGRRIVMRRALG